MYNIKSFNPLPGLFPDYTDVIQAFENQLYDEGGGFLFLPRGGYGLRIINGVWAIKKRPGVSWVGEGQGRTIIKLLDNQGDYETIVGHDLSESMDNVDIAGISFDQNRQNNPVAYADSAAWVASNKFRMVFRFYKAKRLKVSDCRFMNCDNINTLTANGVVENVWIQNNEFDAGNSPIDHDHSSVYIDGARGFVDHNIFIGSGNGARTAVEVHGDMMLPKDNIITGYQIGYNIVSNRTIVTDSVLDVPSPVRVWDSLPSKYVISNNVS